MLKSNQQLLYNMKLTKESQRNILFQTWGLIIMAFALILYPELWKWVFWTLIGVALIIFFYGLDILDYEEDDFP